MAKSQTIYEMLESRYFSFKTPAQQERVDFILSHFTAEALREQFYNGAMHYASLDHTRLDPDGEDKLDKAQLIALRYGLTTLLRLAAYTFAVSGDPPPAETAAARIRTKRHSDFYAEAFKIIRALLAHVKLGATPLTSQELSSSTMIHVCDWIMRILSTMNRDPYVLNAQDEARGHDEYKAFVGRPSYTPRMFRYPDLENLEEWFEEDKEEFPILLKADQITFDEQSILKLLAEKAVFAPGSQRSKAAHARGWIEIICGLIGMSPEDYYTKYRQVYREAEIVNPIPAPLEPYTEE